MRFGTDASTREIPKGQKDYTEAMINGSLMEQAFPFVIAGVCKKEGDMEGGRLVYVVTDGRTLDDSIGFIYTPIFIFWVVSGRKRNREPHHSLKCHAIGVVFR